MHPFESALIAELRSNEEARASQARRRSGTVIRTPMWRRRLGQFVVRVGQRIERSRPDPASAPASSPCARPAGLAGHRV